MIKKFNSETICNTMEVFNRSQSAFLAIFCMGLTHIATTACTYMVLITAFCDTKEEAFKVRDILRHYQRNGDKILIDHIEDGRSNFWSCKIEFKIEDRFEDD